MLGTVISNSNDISLLDSKIIIDLCIGKFYIDLSPSIFIGNGEDLVLGANVQITNPAGVISKPYGSNYEIAPGLSGGMEAVISYNVPTIAGNYQYGTYSVSVELYDAVGNRYVVTKSISLCEPDPLNKTRNYGTLSAILKGVCKDGKLFVIVDGVPTYKGFISESQVNDFTLDYPTASGQEPLDAIVTNFTVVLFEGVYKLEGTICALYNLGDNVYVKINYKVKKEHNVKCIIDLCCVQQQLAQLNSKLDSDCTDAEKTETSNTIVSALFYLKTAELAADCGEDPSDYVSELEKLLGCSCTCNCNEGTPIIDLTPSRDVVVEGCNVTKVSVGLTDTYTINNYEYIVTVTDNSGGGLSVIAASTNGCVKTQAITFNINKVYSAVKTLSFSSQTEALFWASVVRKVLVGLDSTCLGITAAQYAELTFAEVFQAIYDKFCDCCGCGALISNVTATQEGEKLLFEWDENADVAFVDIYLNNVFITTVLGGIGEYSHPIDFSLSDMLLPYKLTARCGKGSFGNSITGTFQQTGKLYIVPPSVYTPYLHGVCPYDLTTNVLPLPAGITAEWHTANNTKAASLVADPTQAIQGSYFLFGKDSEGFYSTGVPITLVCDPTGSCSAPQNLTVVPGFGSNLVQFQSAAYPPPLNSYTVKRRVKSDPDIAGSYTTIGTPVWNASANRWVINDNSAVPNVLYVYRAISNCGGSTTYYIDSDYASIICPTLTITPKVSYINYNFVNSGGDITKYEVSVYEADGVTLIHTNTHLPVFSNPIIGTFAYLDPSTVHFIGLKAYIGTYVKDCGLVSTETLSATSTITLDYIAGQWLVTLSDALPTEITVGNSTQQVLGSQLSNCSVTFESDTLNEIQIPVGELSGEDQTDGLSYLSTYYHIEDGLYISGHGEVNSGVTFMFGETQITVVINRLVCGYYPA